MLENLHKANHDKVDEMLNTIQEAINNENLFDHLMEATKVCSLGQITSALFEVGGQYRRYVAENHFFCSAKSMRIAYPMSIGIS
jgi:methylmalonyl-CoA mutase N-terminal domain/subunit